MPRTYRVSAETVQESSLLIWDRETMRTLLDRYPRLCDNALSTAAGYLDLYIAAHAALVSETAQQRLASVLAHLTDAIGHEVSGGVELQVTNEELASAANITPFTASRILSQWQTESRGHKAPGQDCPALTKAPFPPHGVVALAQRQAERSCHRRVVCNFSNVRVLVVDDSAIWRKFMIGNLYNAGLSAIDVAYDGVQAVQKARTLRAGSDSHGRQTAAQERHRGGRKNPRSGSDHKNCVRQQQ